MVYKCKNCGAKLEVNKTDELVKCEYCGSTNKIEHSPFYYFANMSEKTKKYSRFSAFITIGVIAFGIIISIITNRKAMDVFSSDENSYFGISRYNYYHDGGYPVDYNGDAYSDIVTLAGDLKDDTDDLQVLNGKTGEILKSFEINKEKEAKLFLAGHNYICLAKKDFTLSIYKKENLDEIKTFLLSDKLQYYDFQNNTLYFKTYDDNFQAIDFNTFTLKQKKSKTKLHHKPGDYIHVNRVEENGISYIAKKKAKSSKKVFSVSAKKGNKMLWNIPLGFEDMTWWDGPVLVSEDQTLITFGKKITSDDMGYLIGINKNEGRIKYEVQKSGKNCRVYDLYSNGRYVIANINGCFQAFDPATGETKWTAGNICN